MVPRRTRHQVPPPPGRAPEQEARALDRLRRTGGDHAPVRARHRRHRARLAGARGRAPAQEATARSALGEEGRARLGTGARHALRFGHLSQPSRRLRSHRPGGCARHLHPRSLGAGRVGHEAAFPRRQPQARASGDGAGAQVAPAGRAGGRRGDLCLV